MSDSKDFHREVGQRIVGQLPPPVRQLLKDWHVEVSALYSQPDEEAEELACLTLLLPNPGQMEKFNGRWGRGLNALALHFYQQKILSIGLIFVCAEGHELAYSWFPLSQLREPVPTRWRG